LGGLPLKEEILLFLYIPMFSWRKKKEKLFTDVEVSKLWVCLRFGNMPLGGLPSRGGDPPTFICYCVPIKVKKQKGLFYVC